MIQAIVKEALSSHLLTHFQAEGIQTLLKHSKYDEADLSALGVLNNAILDGKVVQLPAKGFSEVKLRLVAESYLELTPQERTQLWLCLAAMWRWQKMPGADPQWQPILEQCAEVALKLAQWEQYPDHNEEGKLRVVRFLISRWDQLVVLFGTPEVDSPEKGEH